MGSSIGWALAVCVTALSLSGVAQDIDGLYAEVANRDEPVIERARWLRERVAAFDDPHQVLAALVQHGAFLPNFVGYEFFGARDTAAIALWKGAPKQAESMLFHPARTVHDAIARAILGWVRPPVRGATVNRGRGWPRVPGLPLKPTVTQCLDAIASDDATARVSALAMLTLGSAARSDTAPDRIRAALGSDQTAERVGGVLATSDRDALVALREDRDERVRRAAAARLARAHRGRRIPAALRDRDPLAARFAAIVDQERTETVPEVMRLLEQGDAFTRTASMVALWRGRPRANGDPLIQAIEPAIRSPSPFLRRAALLLLLRYPTSARRLASRLGYATRSDKPALQIIAIRALGRVGGGDAVSELMTALENADVEIRAEAVSALAQCGSAAAPAAKPLVRLLSDDALRLRIQRTRRGRRGDPRRDPVPHRSRRLITVERTFQNLGGAAIRELSRALADPDPTQPPTAAGGNAARDAHRVRILQVLASFGAIADDAAERVIPLIDSPTPSVCRQAVETLAALGQTSTIESRLRAALFDAPWAEMNHWFSPSVRNSIDRTLAARLLRDIDRPAVVGALSHEYPRIRRAAAAALAPKNSFETRAEFVAALRSDDETIRSGAVAGAIRIGGFRWPRSQQSDVIVEAMSDSDPVVRWGATAASWTLFFAGPDGKDAKRFLDALAPRLKDDDLRVALAAIDAYRLSAATRVGPLRPLEDLEPLLTHRTETIAGNAAVRLGEAPPSVARDRALLRVMQERPMPLTYRAAVRATHGYPPDHEVRVAVRDTVAATLDSADAVMSLVALLALNRLGAADSLGPRLLALAESPDGLTRQAAMQALGAMPKPPTAALEFLRRKAAERSPDRELAELILVRLATKTHDVGALCRAMESASLRVRRDALRQLVQEGEPALPALTRALLEEDRLMSGLAQQGVVAVGRAKPFLDIIVGDANAAVKTLALKGLASICSREPTQSILVERRLTELMETVDALSAALSSRVGSSDSTSALIRLVSTLGPRGRLATPWLRRLDESHSRHAAAARDVLRKLGEETIRYEDAVSQLSIRGSNLYELLVVIGNRGADAADAVPALLALAKKNPRMAAPIADVFAKIGPPAAPAVEFLIPLLSSHQTEKRALHTLTAIGPAAAAALPALRTFLHGDTRHIPERPIALAAIRAIVAEPADVIPDLTRVLAGDDVRAQLAAIEIAEALGPVAAPLVPALTTALSHTRSDIRRLAGQALAVIRAAPKEAPAPATGPLESNAERRRSAAAIAAAARRAATFAPAVPDAAPMKSALLAARALEFQNTSEMRGLVADRVAHALAERWASSPRHVGGQMSGVHFLADGTLVGLVRGALRVWSTETGRETVRIRSRLLERIAVCPRTGYCATLSRQRNDVLGIVDLNTGERLGEIAPNDGRFGHVSFSPDGTKLAATHQTTIRVFDVHTRAMTALVRNAGVRAFEQLAFVDDDTIMTIDLEQNVRVRRVDGRLMRSWKLSRQTTVMVVSGDGGSVAISNIDGRCTVWEVATGRALASHSGIGRGSLRFSADGKQLLFASANTLKALSIDTGESETLIEFPHPVAWFDVHPNRPLVVAGSWQGVTIADLEKRVVLGEMIGNAYAAQRVRFAPDGASALTIGSDPGVLRWDTRTGRPTSHPGSPRLTHTAIAVSPDGSRFVTASSDKALTMHTAGVDEPRTSKLDEPARSACFSADGECVFVGLESGAIGRFDVPTLERTATLGGHTEGVWSLALHPDGKRLASASLDESIRVWWLADNQEAARFDGHRGGATAVAFHPAGDVLVSNGHDHVVRLWDLASRRASHTLRCDASQPWPRRRGRTRLRRPHVAISPDGRSIAASFHDGTVRFYDFATGELLTALVADGTRVTDFAFSPDGRSMITTGLGGPVRSWDLRPLDRRTVLRHPEPVDSIAFTPNGQLVTGSRDGALRLWDVGRGRQLRRFRLPVENKIIHALAVSSDGNRVIAGSRENAIVIQRLDTAAEAQRIETLAPVSDVAIDAGGQRVLAAASNHDAIWIDVTSRATTRVSRYATRNANAVAIDPNGRWLAFGFAMGRSVSLYSTTAGNLEHGLPAHGQSTNAVEFNADGTAFATAGSDGTVRLYSVAPFRELHWLRGHEGWVATIAFSRSGDLLATGGQDGSVRLWSTSEGRELARFHDRAGWVTAVAFHPSGKLLASASTNRTVRLWPVDSFFLRASGSEIRRALEAKSALRLVGNAVEYVEALTYFNARPPHQFAAPTAPLKIVVPTKQ